MDALVRDGIQLTSFYAFKYCSPSRSAFHSGRNPIHVNVVNGQTTLHNPADPVSGFSGIPKNMTTIAEKLVAAGYRAHAVGKWDVGMATFRHTPAGRGFESWLGYFGHCNDYWTEIDKCGMQTCPSGAATDPENPGTTDMVDMWQQSNFGAVSGPASKLNNSQTCSQKNQMASCHFEDDVFHEQVIRVITQHAADSSSGGGGSGGSSPLFLYWAAHACHGPREVPQATYDMFEFMPDQQARMYAALAHYLDGMVGNVVSELRQQQMWDDTLMVFSSDNGGDSAANNWPLRGAKFSNWEGGIHVPAFVSGGWLPPARRGIKVGGLACLWDLYATFGHLAGLSAAEAVADPVAAAASLPAIDSIDQWDWWSGQTATSPRAELPIGYAVGSSHGAGNAFLTTGVEALIRADGMKLILTPGGPGYQLDEAIWTGPSYPNTSSNMSAWTTTMDCETGCLYNLTEDPTEHVDLSASLPAIVASMKERIEALNRTTFSPRRGEASPLGCEVALGVYGGFCA